MTETLPTMTFLIRTEPIEYAVGPNLKKPSAQRTLCVLLRQPDMSVRQLNLLRDDGDNLVHTALDQVHENGISLGPDVVFEAATRENLKSLFLPFIALHGPKHAKSMLHTAAAIRRIDSVLPQSETTRFRREVTLVFG